jgi:predicted RNA-binding protein with PUA-like domain
MAHWLIKSEPSVYPFAALIKDRSTRWDGIRSFEARNNLRAMKKGELCLFYHSNEGKEIVGIARVKTTAYPDPTAKKDEGDWSVVDVEFVKPFANPVGLAEIKKNKKLASMALIKRSRLSVAPVTDAELTEVLAMAKTKL